MVRKSSSTPAGVLPDSPRRRRGGVVQGSTLDDSGHGGETLHLIQSRLSPLEIVGSRVNLHRIQCASWRKRSEDRAWNKTLTKISVSMALDQMISDGVSHDYARYRSLSASMKRSLRRFARQIAIPKPSKMSTKPVDILVENLSRAKSDRADLGIPSPCLKNGQRYKKLIHFGISAC